MNADNNPFRQLPPVNSLLEHPLLHALRGEHSHELVLAAVRAELDDLRRRLQSGDAAPLDAAGADAIARRVVERVESEGRPTFCPVINATGIVLHTNLGRAPMAEPAARAAYEAARSYLNLEIDLETGQRSSRQAPIREALARLCGAESATVVNNCAAATVIALRALAAGKEVIVSRGQLIEIGGSFRIPEIMAVSGAVLREVGTTNMTRIGDYARAIGSNTALLMRVHTSNYRIRGFTEQTPLAELVELGRQHGLPVIDDTGSGALIDLEKLADDDEPVVPRSVAAGADLVLCSGDKLLGGPQAGIIIGKRTLVERIEKDPLMRAFRLDKMTLAALETTLRLYRNPERAFRDIPVLNMLSVTSGELRPRAEKLAAAIQMIPGVAGVEVRDETAFAGGGSLPDQPLPTVVVSILPQGLSDAEFARRLRLGTPAVLARVQNGRVLFDLRTVFERQEEELLGAIRGALA